MLSRPVAVTSGFAAVVLGTATLVFPVLAMTLFRGSSLALSAVACVLTALSVAVHSLLLAFFYSRAAQKCLGPRMASTGVCLLANLASTVVAVVNVVLVARRQIKVNNNNNSKHSLGTPALVYIILAGVFTLLAFSAQFIFALVHHLGQATGAADDVESAPTKPSVESESCSSPSSSSSPPPSPAEKSRARVLSMTKADLLAIPRPFLRSQHSVKSLRYSQALKDMSPTREQGQPPPFELEASEPVSDQAVAAVAVVAAAAAAVVPVGQATAARDDSKIISPVITALPPSSSSSTQTVSTTSDPLGSPASSHSSLASPRPSIATTMEPTTAASIVSADSSDGEAFSFLDAHRKPIPPSPPVSFSNAKAAATPDSSASMSTQPPNFCKPLPPGAPLRLRSRSCSPGTIVPPRPFHATATTTPSLGSLAHGSSLDLNYLRHHKSLHNLSSASRASSSSSLLPPLPPLCHLGAHSPVPAASPDLPDSGAGEANIHPLFRSDSPNPPPLMTPGSMVHAAPGAGRVMALSTSAPLAAFLSQRTRSASLDNLASAARGTGSGTTTVFGAGRKRGMTVSNVSPRSQHLTRFTPASEEAKVADVGERALTPPIPGQISLPRIQPRLQKSMEIMGM